MKIENITVINFQAIEKVELNNLGDFNVLLGRNNAGKSTIFGALRYLGQNVTGQAWEEPERVLPLHDKSKSLRIIIGVRLDEAERGTLMQPCARGQNDRLQNLIASSAFERMVLTFESVRGQPQVIQLRKTTALSEDRQWATIQQQMDVNVENGDPQVEMTNFGGNLTDLSLASIDCGPSRPAVPKLNKNLETKRMLNLGTPGIEWPHQFAKMFADAFFFSPFRHSESRLQVAQVPTLNQVGTNLAQALHSLNSNDRAKFAEVEQFMQAAIPHVGQMQTPLIGNQTEIAFRHHLTGKAIRLNEMGGGVEQLLMIAYVLLTTPPTSILFIEEPESHLHAGAQRFLLERLTDGGRQVFLTTHSPVFINFRRIASVTQVLSDGSTTRVRPIQDPNALSETLDDIGARNSDVLLSDAVLFVEGTSDAVVIEALSARLMKTLSEANVTIIPMHGGPDSDRSATVRSEVLEGISRAAPVPHAFLIDRDERSEADVQRLVSKMERRLWVLRCREIENYLLVPRAILAALKVKHDTDKAILDAVERMTEDQVKAVIEATANELFGVVLLKRIRTALGPLKGGWFPREMISDLLQHAQAQNLSEAIVLALTNRVSNEITLAKIETIVATQRKLLETDWADPIRRREIAPGEEILSAVFKGVGSAFDKSTDCPRIADEMLEDEIDEELVGLIEMAVDLPRKEGQ